MLSRFPLIDGHNDLPWEIREKFGTRPGQGGPDRARRRHAHRHPAPGGGRGRRPVLVGLRPVEPRRRRGRDGGLRAGRRGAPDDRRLPGPLPAGADRRRRGRGVQGGQDRLPARRGGRPQHQQLARRAPLAARPGRPLHDADAQRQRRLGRLGDRRAGLRRPVGLRPRGRGGDAAPRHARRPVARRGFHHERRAGHGHGPRSSSPTPPPGRSPTTRATSPTTCSRGWRSTAACAWWRSSRSSSRRSAPTGSTG